MRPCQAASGGASGLASPPPWIRRRRPHADVHRQTHRNIIRYIHTYMYMYMYMCVYIYIYIYTCIYVYIYIYMYMYVYTYYIYIHTGTLSLSLYIYIYICVYVCVYIYMYIYIHTLISLFWCSVRPVPPLPASFSLLRPVFLRLMCQSCLAALSPLVLCFLILDPTRSSSFFHWCP